MILTKILSLLIWIPIVLTASLERIANYNNAASVDVAMYVYVPDNVVASPPIIVAIHYCTGTAAAYYSFSPYASLADEYGFIVIYPESPYTGGCWDVSSNASLTHDGGADSEAIGSMVIYALYKYGGDWSRVFVTGTSSGAMMTNVMAATYPNLFAAATVYSGVAAGCDYNGTVDGWNSACVEGQIDHTPEAWAAIVEAMYPGYTGARPRMQIYHGSADVSILPENYNETIDEWAGVLGYDPTSAQSIESDFPQSGYTTFIWGADGDNPLGELQGIYADGVGHTVPINGTQDMMWFRLGPYAA